MVLLMCLPFFSAPFDLLSGRRDISYHFLLACYNLVAHPVGSAAQESAQEQRQEAWWTERSCRKHLDAVADARSGDASHGRAVPALPAGFARGGKCASGTSPGDRSASQAAGEHRTSGRVQSLSRVPAGDTGRLSGGGASAGAVWSGVWGDRGLPGPTTTGAV